MIKFDDISQTLEKTDHSFSREIIQFINQDALRELVKRGYPGMFLVPMLYVVCACLTEYRTDNPPLFLLLLLLFAVFSMFRIASTAKIQKGPPVWQTIYFVSSIAIGLLFGFYAASSILIYGASWTNAVMFFSSEEARILGVFCVIACAYNYWQAGVWNKNFWLAHINIYLLQNEIEKQKHLEQGILKERDRARHANKAKTEFLANMSHELRTPMHGILSYADFGVRRSHKISRDKLLKYFYEIADSGNRLMTLLNDLLDLAKLESGKMNYTMTAQDLSDGIVMVLNEFQPLIEKKELKLIVDLPKTELVTCFDSDRIAQVLRNLLSNSVKFSKTGQTISIHARQRIVILERKEQSAIMVSVKDEGVGIPEEELSSVFDKFIQSSKTRTGAGGTGLGLAICKQIVEEHKGRIEVSNNPDGGTMFSFYLPVLRRKDDA